ncbi:MAG: DsrE/DsrF/DrsH-like family protein [Anaerolineaceae bacterium]|nr:DsrE/DsrF/DrsH-like family protein [Anaerolineaceae bacterium]
MNTEIASAVTEANVMQVKKNENSTKNKVTLVCLSGDLDKVMAALIIATGAAASGMEVTMFFTFWGMKAIQKDGIYTGKGLFGRMLGFMNRGGLNAIGPSRLNMGGLGRWMFKLMMKQKGAAQLPELYEMAVDLNVKMMPCQMTMDVMEYDPETDFKDNVTEPVGVAAMLEEAAESKVTMFI